MSNIAHHVFDFDSFLYVYTAVLYLASLISRVKCQFDTLFYIYERTCIELHDVVPGKRSLQMSKILPLTRYMYTGQLTYISSTFDIIMLCKNEVFLVGFSFCRIKPLYYHRSFATL